jgi:K+/H+ antiporter YhaU regulatory subunit KhtT
MSEKLPRMHGVHYRYQTSRVLPLNVTLCAHKSGSRATFLFDKDGGEKIRPVQKQTTRERTFHIDTAIGF